MGLNQFKRLCPAQETMNGVKKNSLQDGRKSFPVIHPTGD
jgi:hypothetical protein